MERLAGQLLGLGAEIIFFSRETSPLSMMQLKKQLQRYCQPGKRSSITYVKHHCETKIIRYMQLPT